MTDAEKIEALLDLVDETRAERRDQSETLVVFGLAERRGRVFGPTNAGWNLMSDLGRPFDNGQLAT